MSMYDFGLRLKELREKKKLTQTQVAKRLNLNKSTIFGYENNIKTPSVNTLTQLALFYGVSSDYLLGLENRKVICVENLSDRQHEILNILLLEFHEKGL